jgi:hypothetical protein
MTGITQFDSHTHTLYILRHRRYTHYTSGTRDTALGKRLETYPHSNTNTLYF